MARPIRLQYPQAAYHVAARGNEGRVIFRDKGDRRGFLAFLRQARERFALHESSCTLADDPEYDDQEDNASSNLYR